MSLVMRKPAICTCENKDADLLRSNCADDQRLCFHYTDSTIPLLHKYEISSLYPSSVAVQPGLCQTWSETPKTGFLTTRLIYATLNITKTQVELPKLRQAIGPKCEHRIDSKFMMKGCLRLVINKWSRCNKMPYIFLSIFNNCFI